MRAGNALFFPFLKRTGENCRINVFCFNHAGGSASSYYLMMKKIHKDIRLIPVELAGHGARMDEQSVQNWDILIENCCNAISEFCSDEKRPFILLGCSLGTLIAFRCALRLEQLGKAPARLILCAHSAPQLPVPGYKSSMGIEKLPQEVGKLGGLSQEIINSEEFKKYFLPVIFRDYQLHDSFEYHGEKLITTPIDTFYGKKDIYFGKDSMLAWNEASKCGASCTEIDGDHFFAYDPDKFGIMLEKICLSIVGEE